MPASRLADPRRAEAERPGRRQSSQSARQEGVTAAWNPQRYQGRHSFVWQFGEQPAGTTRSPAGRADSRSRMRHRPAYRRDRARRGARVVGLDHSAEMLEQARKNFPELQFEQADAATFRFAEPFDAVFSNAALHWVKDQAGAAARIARASRRRAAGLWPNLAEKAASRSVVAAMRAVLGAARGSVVPLDASRASANSRPCWNGTAWKCGQAFLFDRPTLLEGESGMDEWLRMFCGAYFRGLSAQETRDTMARLVATSAPRFVSRRRLDADYRRLRVVARKLAV